MKDSILVVIVLYKTALTDSLSFRTLDDGRLPFFIYDNSPESGISSDIENAERITYTHNPLNPGLSYAYNQAAKYAIENGYNWLLICDQDTEFPVGMMDAYKKYIHQYPSVYLFCPKVKIRQTSLYMSPVPMSHYSGQPVSSVDEGIVELREKIVINSGLLINVAAFTAVGGYNDKVKLDFSDIQFIERFSNQFKEGCVINQECIQGYSNFEQSPNEKISRFKEFCKSLKEYQPVNKKNTVWLKFIVLKRALSLCRQAKSLQPLRILFKNYF